MIEYDRHTLEYMFNALNHTYKDGGDTLDELLTTILIHVMLSGEHKALLLIVSPYPITEDHMLQTGFIQNTRTGCRLTDKGKEFLRGDT